MEQTTVAEPRWYAAVTALQPDYTPSTASHELALTLINDGDHYAGSSRHVVSRAIAAEMRGRLTADMLGAMFIEGVITGAIHYCRQHAEPGTPWWAIFTAQDIAAAACEIACHYAESVVSAVHPDYWEGN